MLKFIFWTFEVCKARFHEVHILVAGKMVFILQARYFKRGMNFDYYVAGLGVRSSDSAGGNMMRFLQDGHVSKWGF